MKDHRHTAKRPPDGLAAPGNGKRAARRAVLGLRLARDLTVGLVLAGLLVGSMACRRREVEP